MARGSLMVEAEGEVIVVWIQGDPAGSAPEVRFEISPERATLLAMTLLLNAEIARGCEEGPVPALRRLLESACQSTEPL